MTNTTTNSAASTNDISDWRPEDEQFWESTGKRIAYRNLWISVPALLCGFAIWGMWGIITVQMLNLGFPFSQAELFSLTAIAGLAGATMRIPASFLIRLSGGRNTIFLTTAMLLTLMVTSKGIAGVPRASLVVIAATLAYFKIPEAGLLLILAVDHLLDMGRSATNVVGNSVASVVVAKWENQLETPEPEPAKA